MDLEVNSGSALIDNFIPNSDFYDRHELELHHDSLSALELYIALASITPKWVNLLMLARNKFVSLFGLKNLGTLDDIKGIEVSKVKLGDRLGIFSLTYLSDREVILNDTDKHLSVNLSLRVAQKNANQYVIITTVVNNHNKLGVLYMLFVKPVHSLIVPIMLTRLKSKSHLLLRVSSRIQ